MVSNFSHVSFRIVFQALATSHNFHSPFTIPESEEVDILFNKLFDYSLIIFQIFTKTVPTVYKILQHRII